MRRAVNNINIITDHDRRVFGISLGYEYCAEHEYGIERLERDFALDLNELGFEGRRNREVPGGLVYRKRKDSDASVLLYLPALSLGDDGGINYLLQGPLSFNGRRDLPDLVSAWNESSFGIHATLGYDSVLSGLYQAFQDKNGVIILKAGSLHTPALCLFDYNLIPDDLKRSYREEHERHKKMGLT